MTQLVLAAGLLASAELARAQQPGSALTPLQASTVLQPPARGEAARRLPIVLQARQISGQPELEIVAEGDVEFRRGSLVMRADRMAYDMPQDLATARGQVRVRRDGATYSGPELAVSVQRFEGYFLRPEFDFPSLGAGGRADRLDFLGEQRMRATNAEYTSCPRDGPDEPDWVLKASRVSLDLEADEGVAEGAVLRFLGAPILVLPTLSFPLSDQRKSGWLPPNVNFDSQGGLELALPYYWNIAPHRDLTVAPRFITRRGLALDGEVRYLEPGFGGSLGLQWLPDDRLAGRQRHGGQWIHEGELALGARYGIDVARVSDDDWWKDFRNVGNYTTTRLLPSRLFVERPFGFSGAQGAAYLRAAYWQPLQATDSPIVSPYQRSPQVGVRLGGGAAGVEYTLESEYNRFTLPHGDAAREGRAGGERVHLLGSLSLPHRVPGWWVVPRLSVNAASYNADSLRAGPQASRSRIIPTFSVDTGVELERRTQAFGRDLLQTLEPRLLYVNTPYRAQSQFPVYDTSAKDFNFVSIYTDNAFAGIDRVSDAHQITVGLTTRLVDSATGTEALHLGLAQRYLIRNQLVTSRPDGKPDGEPLERRWSDLLLRASTSVIKSWTLDAALQYSPEISRSLRSIVSAGYSPGPFRTVGATYSFARGLSEQVGLGWQWPVWGAPAGQAARSAESGASCSGAWYSVGRANYSVKDRRATDSVLGVEYDAGCWIARVVAERLSTGRSEATTRLMLQVELVGLSRIGSNPLQVLKDNVPGYRLLREDRRPGAQTDEWQP